MALLQNWCVRISNWERNPRKPHSNIYNKPTWNSGAKHPEGHKCWQGNTFENKHFIIVLLHKWCPSCSFVLFICFLVANLIITAEFFLTKASPPSFSVPSW